MSARTGGASRPAGTVIPRLALADPRGNRINSWWAPSKRPGGCMTASQPLTDTPQTLDQCLARGPIPMAQALPYVIALGERLRQIHEAGGVHGVLSPSNIIVSGTRLEPGAAAVPGGSAAAYTAPELLEGRGADTCSDIFSFGALASEILTGRNTSPARARRLRATRGSTACWRAAWQNLRRNAFNGCRRYCWN